MLVDATFMFASMDLEADVNLRVIWRFLLEGMYGWWLRWDGFIRGWNKWEEGGVWIEDGTGRTCGDLSCSNVCPVYEVGVPSQTPYLSLDAAADLSPRGSSVEVAG